MPADLLLSMHRRSRTEREKIHEVEWEVYAKLCMPNANLTLTAESLDYDEELARRLTVVSCMSSMFDFVSNPSDDLLFMTSPAPTPERTRFACHSQDYNSQTPFYAFV